MFGREELRKDTPQETTNQMANRKNVTLTKSLPIQKSVISTGLDTFALFLFPTELSLCWIYAHQPLKNVLQ